MNELSFIDSLSNKVFNGELTLKAALQEMQSSLVSLQPIAEKDSHFNTFMGKNVFIRTATYHVTGILKHVGATEFVLEKAAWIADSGSFAKAIASGDFSEIEPYPDNTPLIVGRGALIDMCLIPTLPRTQK